MPFDTVQDLINYYRVHRLLTPAPSQEEIILREHVPRRVSHDNRPWWHPQVTRQGAMDLLGNVRRDGAFLVRPSAHPYSYAISFRAEGRIKHCGIATEGPYLQQCIIGSAHFDSLCELVEYYQKRPLYKHFKLKYVVNSANSANAAGVVDGLGDLGPEYVVPNRLVEAVEAIYNYDARRDDELTFKKGDIIVNVKTMPGGWWQGDL